MNFRQASKQKIREWSDQKDMLRTRWQRKEISQEDWLERNRILNEKINAVQEVWRICGPGQ